MLTLLKLLIYVQITNESRLKNSYGNSDTYLKNLLSVTVLNVAL